MTQFETNHIVAAACLALLIVWAINQFDPLVIAALLLSSVWIALLCWWALR